MRGRLINDAGVTKEVKIGFSSLDFSRHYLEEI